jgi:uncharacterized protein
VAVHYYELSAANGYAPAQYNLAQLVEKGKGTKRDDAEAFQWYKKAADQGFAAAQAKVSDMYARGQGVTANAEQAYFWSTLAAKQNEKNAERRAQALAANLSPDAVSRAKKSAGEWKPVLTSAR